MGNSVRMIGLTVAIALLRPAVLREVMQLMNPSIGLSLFCVSPSLPAPIGY